MSKDSRLPNLDGIRVKFNGQFRKLAFIVGVGAVTVVATIIGLNPVGPHVFSIEAGCIGLAVGIVLGYMASPEGEKTE